MAIQDIIRKAAAHHPLSPKHANDALIPVTRLPGHVRIDPAKAIAVRDPRVIARITDAVPGLSQAALQAQTAVRYGSHALYEVILPPGASLKPHVRAGQDLFYGAGKTADGKSVFPDFRKLSSAHETAQIAAAAMNAASIVVGQYYMSLIDGELKAIRGVLQELLDLQLDEYRGAIQALIDQVNKMTDHQAEVLLNDELRGRVLSALDACERDCARQHEQRPIGESTALLLRTQMHPPTDRLTAFESKFEQSSRLLFDGETLYYLND